MREPVGTVGAIVPWNSPHGLIPHKVGPALLAGCTVVLKMSPEAPGAGYLVAEAAEEIGLPPGVLNVVTADREVSELLVRDPRIDKITFTGSTAAGRKIGAICGERIARMTLELGGKSAAVILDDADIASRGEDARQGRVRDDRPGVLVAHAHRRHARAARRDGRGARRELPARCASATRSTRRPRWARSPCARQRDRVEGYIAKGIDGRRDARRRRQASRAPRPRLVHRADRVRQRRQRLDDRAGGDLRAGAQRDPGRRRAGRGADRERHDLRPELRRVHARSRPRPGGRAASCAPAPSA